MPSDKLTSIIILAWNQLDFTRLCLESIQAFTPEPHELILVDNGSTDGTPEYLAELAARNTRVRVITNKENLGFAKGCNQGLAVASGDYLLLLNNDTIVTPGWLSNLLACAQSDERIGVVGPVTNFISGPQCLPTTYEDMPQMLTFAEQYNRSNPESWEDMQRLVGFAMLIRREAYDEVGGLDERFGTGCYEDDDYCVRMSLAGYRLVMARDTFIHHFGNRTFIGNNVDIHATIAENCRYFAEKWAGEAQAAATAQPVAARAIDPGEPGTEKDATYYNHVRPEILGLVPGSARRVLDVGCGSGRLGEALKHRQNCEVWGLELFPAAAAEARGRLDGVLEGDLETLALPFDAGYFDCIVCADVLEHLRDPWSVLTKLNDLLAPDGVVVISLPNVANWEVIRGLLSGRWEYLDAGILDATHLRFFTLESCVGLIEKAGLRVVQSGHVAGPEAPDAVALSTLLSQFKLINPDFLTTSRVIQYLFVAQKAGAMAVHPGSAFPAMEAAMAGSQAAANRHRSTLSLCMIVKNEEEYLPRCLMAAKPWVDEIIIVDTGSTDRTVEIAEGFGAKVLHHAWTGDFSAARNVSLEAATSDWIMFLDADEEIVDGDGPKLRQLLHNPRMSGWYLNLISFVGDKPGQEAVCNLAFRIFRNHPKHRFSGRLHEQIVASVQMNGGELGFSEVRANHYGYLNKPSVDKNKVNRNYEILLKEVEDRPDDPFVHFNLGVEYMRLGKHEEALEAYRKSFRHLPSLEAAYASILVRNISLCLINLKWYRDALKVLNDGLEGFPDYTDLLYLKGLVHAEMKEYATAIEVYKECLKRGESASRHISQVGVGGYKAWHGIGDSLTALGDYREAVKAYTKALQGNRRFLGPLFSLVNILLDHDEPKAVVAFLERLVDLTDVDTLAVAAHAFTLKGKYAEALDLLQRARDIEPQQRFDLLIGEALLNLGRFDEAVAELSKISSDSQHFFPAVLDQVFCHLVLGDSDNAMALLSLVPVDSGYAVAANVDALLLKLMTGEQPALVEAFDPEICKQYQETAWNMLQKLLEARKFDLFEQALDLLPLTGVTPEETEVRLGKLYYAQGYVDSAVEELGKALNAGRCDADAFGILAEVCKTRGLSEEAAQFYQAGLELDPARLTFYTGLVSSLGALRRYHDAVEVLREGLRHLPSSELLKQTLKGIEALAG